MEIKEVSDINEKMLICEKVLRSLPEWFGIEESTKAYIEGVKDKPFYAIFDEGNVFGFVSLKHHFEKSAELYVLGLLPEYHGKGHGESLIGFAEERAKELGYQFMNVKTLSERKLDPNYDKTRNFYLKIGYLPLEEFPTLWGETNPCLLLVKAL